MIKLLLKKDNSPIPIFPNKRIVLEDCKNENNAKNSNMDINFNRSFYTF